MFEIQMKFQFNKISKSFFFKFKYDKLEFVLKFYNEIRFLTNIFNNYCFKCNIILNR